MASEQTLTECQPTPDLPDCDCVTIKVKNNFQEPYFEFEAKIPYSQDKYLLHYLESAANQNTQFMFTAKYFTSQRGFFIQAINDLFGNEDNKTFWKILDDFTDTPLDLGVSAYVPSKGQTIRFEFVSWENYKCRED